MSMSAASDYSGVIPTLLSLQSESDRPDRTRSMRCRMPLMAGEIASLFLSRMTVPVLYGLTHRRRSADQA